MSKTFQTPIRISIATQDAIDEAESRHRANGRVYRLSDAVDEFLSLDLLGTFGRVIFDTSLSLDFADLMDRPMREVDAKLITERWGRLWASDQPDRARWMIVVWRGLLRFARARHPELRLSHDDVTIVLPQLDGEVRQ